MCRYMWCFINIRQKKKPNDQQLHDLMVNVIDLNARKGKKGR